MKSLQSLLLQAQSNQPEHRNSAYLALEESLHRDPAHLFHQLSLLLFDESSAKEVRLLSGIYLKNNIAKCWELLLNEAKAHIKKNCLGTLASSDIDVVKSGAIAVSAISLLELPKGEWFEVLDVLISNCHNTNNTFQHASLLALGYICEDLHTPISNRYKNAILTGIIASLSTPVPHIKQTALNAFKNSVRFYQQNFASAQECHMILSSIFSMYSEFPVLTLQALCEIMLNFPFAFAQDLIALGTITYSAIKCAEDSAALMGIEVWSVAGDIERGQIEAGEPRLGYLDMACKSLTELLLPKLLMATEDDEWTVSKAAYFALSTLALVCEAKNVEIVYKFISENLQSAGGSTQAGLLALASVFEEEQSRAQRYTDFFDIVIDRMASQNLWIQKNAIWCVGKIAKNACNTFDKCQLAGCKDSLQSIINSNSSNTELACWALGRIIEKSHKVFDYRQYQGLLKDLTAILNQKLSGKTKMFIFNLLSTVLEKLPEAYNLLFEEFFPSIFEIYCKSCELEENVMICATNALQVVCVRIRQEKISMKDVEFIINKVVEQANTYKMIFEESLQLIGSLAINTGLKFSNYFQSVSPYIIYAINQLDTPEVLKSGIIALSDIARSLGSKLQNFVFSLMPSLFQVMENDKITIACKILCINCLGDIAGAIKSSFVPYLPTVFKYLDGAAGISLKISTDSEVNESFAELRECIVQFYVGLIQGLAECQQHNLIIDRIRSLCDYIAMVTQEKYSPSVYLHQAALLIIGDLIQTYDDYQLASQFDKYINHFLGGRDENEEAARWLLSLIASHV